MVAVILLVAAAGLFAVGSVRGWFGGRQDAATLCDVRGVVSLTRGGVAYPVEEETALRAGDALACDTGATALIRLSVGTLWVAARRSRSCRPRRARSGRKLPPARCL